MSFMSKIKKPLALGLAISGGALTITGASLLGVGCEFTGNLNISKEMMGEGPGFLPEEGMGSEGSMGSGSPAESVSPATTYAEPTVSPAPEQTPENTLPGYTPDQITKIITDEFPKIMKIGQFQSGYIGVGLGSSNWGTVTSFNLKGNNGTYDGSSDMKGLLQAILLKNLVIPSNTPGEKGKEVKTYSDFREWADFELKEAKNLKENQVPPGMEAMVKEAIPVLEKVQTGYAMMVSGAVLFSVFVLVMAFGIFAIFKGGKTAPAKVAETTEAPKEETK